mmetsp:Transcript_41816/g.66440  ORF Transcript_41816/g.66440 Transcript_41816/m.66440 type:complete len:83 (-) Transcript_41816:296-544(-)
MAYDAPHEANSGSYSDDTASIGSQRRYHTSSSLSLSDELNDQSSSKILFSISSEFMVPWAPKRFRTSGNFSGDAKGSMDASS